MVRDASVECGMAKDKLTTAFLVSFVVASLCHSVTMVQQSFCGVYILAQLG